MSRRPEIQHQTNRYDKDAFVFFLGRIYLLCKDFILALCKGVSLRQAFAMFYNFTDGLRYGQAQVVLLRRSQCWRASWTNPHPQSVKLNPEAYAKLSPHISTSPSTIDFANPKPSTRLPKP